jgi:carbon storage regulator CsrA
MLILARKKDEQIAVPGCCLTITVLDVGRSRVRLGISAPAGVRVYRGEVLQPPRSSHEYQDSASAELEASVMPARVLIADSDQYLLDSYRKYLEQQGFDVVTATTGLECVERLRDSVPDALVLEPSIPWGWGDGVLAMMQEEPDIPSVPVIVLTYGRDRGVLYRLAPFKIDDYQVKPLRPQRLAERIRAVAKRRTFEAGPIEHRQSPTSHELTLHR